MGAVLSISVVDALTRATTSWNYARARRRSIAPHGAADWPGLPEDLLLTVMAALDVPSIIRSGAVCTSWHSAYKAFRGLHRLPPKQAPCLLYACDEYGPDAAALYCPSTNATFRIPFPQPPDKSRRFAFSCQGWVFAADEAGDPYLVNPTTGSRAALPPFETIYHGESHYDRDRKNALKARLENRVFRPTVSWAWHSGYHRVAISAAAEVAACTVLIVHTPDQWRLSFARPGDKRWTFLCEEEFQDVLYNDKDGLFYALGLDSSVSTIDLAGPSPTVTMIMRGVSGWCDPTKYLAFTPSGELQQVWRIWSHPHFSVKFMVDADAVDFANEYGDAHNLNEPDANDDDEQKTSEVTTIKLLIFKVDIGRQKLVELRDIGDHALFLGYNTAMYFSTKDFPVFKPNCAYLTHDCFDFKPTLPTDTGIWDVNKGSMQKLQDAWPYMYSWLDLPAPIWITPRF
ncbi:putative F-box protein At4g22660 [Aegilops tauschii subsp. strangulata]|nr:putative F-box protein At4g22660 [Aegilops tauschii subsp. strangulata]